jgi:predicted AAA+ superfamily ATPase
MISVKQCCTFGEERVNESELFMEVLKKLDHFLSRCSCNAPEDIAPEKYRAFVWNGAGKYLKPITRPVRIGPKDLIGIGENKNRIMRNTKHFIDGGRANNVLLWGERGTGKSSLVKAMLTAFADSRLRMMHVYKHDILTIQEMYDFITENQEYRFIIFIDDLSFEESQTDYKELKTIMDGGLEEIPENLLFYATSNRKHLVPTRFSDRDNDEIRPSDTMEEKISLVDRFGLKLGFHHFPQETYLSIVDLYIEKYGVAMDRDTLHRRAIQWALETGGRNGRTAEQFAREVQGL